MKMPAFLLALLLPWAAASCRKSPPPPSTPNVIPPAVGTSVPTTTQPFPRFLRATGQLTAPSDAIIAADAIGRVISAPIERGAAVKSGDVLALLDERQPQIALAEAAASLQLVASRLALAKNELQRNQPLAEKKAVAAADFQKFLTEVAAREAEVAAAQARLAQAQLTLENCSIRAPFDGVVAQRLVEPGTYLKADSPVARLVDLTTLRLVLSIPETAVASLEIGQSVEFSTAAYPQQSFPARLQFLSPALREASRDLVVEATVANPDHHLRPGFFCDARILLRREPALALPSDALRRDGSRSTAFAISPDGILSERLLEVGESHGGFTEIRRGLAAGESVLAKPGPSAADGARFLPAPPTP